MAQFVLIHGSFHGAWCWERLIPLLEAAGHRVIAPDLPGSGSDIVSWRSADLEGYTSHISATIDRMDGSVVLVGHSMGGIVTSQVAERHSDRLLASVYINGLLLQSGESLVSFLGDHAYLDVDDLVLKNMVVSADGLIATFPPEKAADVFYNTCKPSDADWAAKRLTPQRTKIYSDKLQLSSERYGRVPRFYVKGLADNAVSPTYQEAMLANTSCEKVFTLGGDHSPFLYAAPELAELLTSIV